MADRYARKIVFIPMPDRNEIEELGLKKTFQFAMNKLRRKYVWINNGKKS